MIPHFNHGKQPFYIQYFYGNYGTDMPEIIGRRSIRHPNRVVADATQPDRLRFYKRSGAGRVGWTACGRTRSPC